PPAAPRPPPTAASVRARLSAPTALPAAPPTPAPITAPLLPPRCPPTTLPITPPSAPPTAASVLLPAIAAPLNRPRVRKTIGTGFFIGCRLSGKTRRCSPRDRGTTSPQPTSSTTLPSLCGFLVHRTFPGNAALIFRKK